MILTNNEAKTILLQVKNLTSVKVYLLIRGHEQKNAEYSVTYGELHKTLGMSQTQLTTCLKELVELGLLVKDGRQYKTSHEYTYSYKPNKESLSSRTDKLFKETYGYEYPENANYVDETRHSKLYFKLKDGEVNEALYDALIKFYEVYGYEYKSHPKDVHNFTEILNEYEKLYFGEVKPEPSRKRTPKSEDERAYWIDTDGTKHYL